MSPEVEPLALAGLVVRVVEELRPLAELKGIRLSILIDPFLIVRADAEMLETIASDLVLNALESCYEGGRLRIASRKEPDGWIYLSFKDDGPAIPAEDLLKVFEGSHQRRPRRTSQGTGARLAYCRRAAEAMGGAITALSGDGIGAEFVIQLRSAEEAPDAAGRRSERVGSSDLTP